MEEKTLLLATFVEKSKIRKFLFYIYKVFNVNQYRTFIFDTGQEDYVITYRIKIAQGEKMDIKDKLKRTIQVHKKGSCFFTINALNKLIEQENHNIGNINHKDFKVDWDKYSDSFILYNGDKLDIIKVKKVVLDDL